MIINKLIASILPYMPEQLVWIFSRRYIAGKSVDSAIKISKKLNTAGRSVSVDLLGEYITTLEQAEENKQRYLSIIEENKQQNINGNFSLKPSMFGLLIDENECYYLIKEIVSKAAQNNSFIRLDMEDSSCVDLEINLYKKLLLEYPNNVGLVFQAYLRRTYNDIVSLKADLPNSNLNLRLCKGIYREPESIAFKEHDKINKCFLDDLEFIIQNNIFVGIATHDKYLIKESKRLIKEYKLSTSKYEFQMLYGVNPTLRNRIIKNKHPLRVYIPFGEKWFKYSTRRLKENPTIIKHIIKAIFYNR